MTDCIFCKIARGELPCHKVWESATHIAFLSIFPSMKGFTVVASKKHLPSKVETLAAEDYTSLFLAGKTVQQLLTKALGVDRTALVAEGTGVDHAHLKLIPLIGTTPSTPWTGGEAHQPVTFQQYAGYISTREGERADDAMLSQLAKQIRGNTHG